MITYKVQYGDTLYTIAQHFGICVGILVMSNNILRPYQLFEGQDLLIPITISKGNYKLENDLEKIKRILSQEGTVTDGVLKFAFPRYDLIVKIDNIILDPNLALTSWVAFNQLGNRSIMMGDLVLLENEVGPVMSSLLNNGIEITALHNHLQHESPRIMYLHIKGEGEPIKLSQNIINALSLTTTPLKIKQQQSSSQNNLKVIEDILKRKGSYKGNVLQLSFPRNITISEDDYKVPPSMGISHGINFQNAGDHVATTGDFVLLAYEVNPVANILKKNNIDVTAIHNHMLTETPRLFFMHFWAVGKSEHLSQTFKSVLALAK